MSTIHPTAIVDAQVELADGVSIGPYSVIEGKVWIGPGTVIKAHCVVNGSTRIGANCQIGPAAYVGLDPQHLGFKGGESWLTIGDDVLIREGASVHRASKLGEENATRVGNKCFLMGATHVAHDCQLEDDVIMANAALLGGHVAVGRKAFIGGGAIMHQFCRVGRLAMVGGNEAISRDIPPFSAVRYGGLKGYNSIGCNRAGMSRPAIRSIRAAYYCLQSIRTTSAAVKAIRELATPPSEEVRELLDFIAGSKRGIQPSVRFASQYRGKGDEE